MKIGFLVSGKLGFTALRDLTQETAPCFVITDRNSSDVIDLCQSQGWPVFIGKPAGDRFSQFKNSQGQPDLLVSMNFLFLVDSQIISWSRLPPINIHGSLLPKYRGRAPHIWAIINGELETGITVHQVDESCDTGDILFQEKIPLSGTITGGEVLSIFEERYPKILKKVIASYLQGEMKPVRQIGSAATFFGKRTPEDGQIDWSWQYEQIRNWVRALTSPYPGAFSHWRQHKIKILEIKRSDMGFDWLEANGTVKKSEGNSLWVKCPNCVIEIVKYELEDAAHIVVGDILQ